MNIILWYPVALFGTMLIVFHIYFFRIRKYIKKAAEEDLRKAKVLLSQARQVTFSQRDLEVNGATIYKIEELSDLKHAMRAIWSVLYDWQAGRYGKAPKAVIRSMEVISPALAQAEVRLEEFHSYLSREASKKLAS